MTRKDKLTERLLQRPRDFTWDELVRLLGSLGFESVKGGKTGGLTSAVCPSSFRDRHQSASPPSPQGTQELPA